MSPFFPARHGRHLWVAALLWFPLPGAETNWYTNGPVVSRIPFDRLPEKGIFVFDTNGAPANAGLAPVDPAATIQGLIDRGDASVLQSLTLAFGLTNQAWGTNLSGWRNVLRERLPGSPVAALQSSNTLLLDRAHEGPVILRRADTLESLPVTQGGKKENIIRLRGQVETFAAGSLIRADTVLVNTDTRDLVAEGSVKISGRDLEMSGQRLWVNLSNRQGVMFGVKGRLAGFFYDGVAFKLNPDDHYTFEQVALTTESNERPHFHLQVGKLQNPAKNAYYANDILFKVHNAPFFYFPFLFQEPFGTGVHLNAGQTTREGYYLQNSLGVHLPVVGDTIFRANFYEKIGSHFSAFNTLTTPLFNYSANLGLAFTWDNRYIENYQYGNSLVNAAWTGENLERNTRTRYKIDLAGGLSLTDPATTPGIQNRLEARFYQTSDPFFSHNMERSLPSLDILSLLRNNTIEGRYVPQATDVRQLALQYTLAAPGISFGVGGRWAYQNYENWTYLDTFDTRHWESRLDNIVLPEIVFRLNGAIDPPRSPGSRKEFLNIGYGVAMGYRLQDFYTITNNTFHHHDNLFTVDVSATRPLVWSQDFHGKDLEAFDLTLSPALSFNYRKRWGGEEIDITYLSNNLRDTRLSANVTGGLSLNFPANKTKQAWNAATNFRSMLPVAQLNASYTLVKEDTLAGTSLDALFPKYNTHMAQAGFSASQRGYGLFYIPYLDIGHQFNLNAAYDLRPRTSAATGLEVPFEWTQDRFLNFEGNWSTDITYRNLFRLSWTMPIGILDRPTQALVAPKALAHNLALNLNWTRDPRSKSSLVFQWESINTTFNWQMQNQASLWYQDSMGFTLVTRFTIGRLFDLSLNLAAMNRTPWIYLADKAKAAGVTPVDFFSDLGDSIGLGGFDGLRRGHFKLTSVEAALTHDLDSWFLRLVYQLTPVPLANAGAVRGYYFDQRVSFEINLKPEFRPPGFKDGFPPWKETFIPDVLKQQGRQ